MSNKRVVKAGIYDLSGSNPELRTLVLRAVSGTATLSGYFINFHGDQIGRSVTMTVTTTAQTLYNLMDSTARQESGWNSAAACGFLGRLSGSDVLFGHGGNADDGSIFAYMTPDGTYPLLHASDLVALGRVGAFINNLGSNDASSGVLDPLLPLSTFTVAGAVGTVLHIAVVDDALNTVGEYSITIDGSFSSLQTLSTHLTSFGHTLSDVGATGLILWASNDIYYNFSNALIPPVVTRLMAGQNLCLGSATRLQLEIIANVDDFPLSSYQFLAESSTATLTGSYIGVDGRAISTVNLSITNGAVTSLGSIPANAVGIVGRIAGGNIYVNTGKAANGSVITTLTSASGWLEYPGNITFGRI